MAAVIAILLFLFSVCTCLSLVESSDADHPGDSAALTDFYHSLNGADWYFQSNWLSPSKSFCKWFGIKCAACNATIPCRVISFDFESNNAVGTFPPSMGNFSELIAFTMTGNDIRGSIPEEISKLTKLQTLRIGFSSIVSVPSSISTLNRLLTLDLTSNKIVVLNPAVGSIPNLRILRISDNLFRLADVSFLQNLSRSLLQMHASQEVNDQAEDDISWIGNLVNLQRLRLSGLNGPFPFWLSRLNRLSILMMDNNRFTDMSYFASSICALTRASELLITKSNLTGSLPACIFDNLPLLSTLALTNNRLSSTLPNNFDKVPRLSIVEFDVNLLVGTIPPSVCQLPVLFTFSAPNNFFTGDFSCFSNATSIRNLFLSNNLFDGTISPALGQLPYITHLSVNNNLLRGTIPPELGSLVLLEGLDLSVNHLVGTIPAALGQLVQAVSIILCCNRLSGSIPEMFSTLIIFELDLSHNQLTGALPATIGDILSYFSRFSVANNQISGPIPDSYGKLRGLVQFNVANNLLNGTLPSWFGKLHQLTTINISSNLFTGSLPTALTELPSILTIDLTNNFFTGSLSDFISNAKFAPLVINVGENLLSGPIRSLQPLNSTTRVSFVDARRQKNQLKFECPIPLYDQDALLFLRDTCLPQYSLFFQYVGFLALGALLLLVARWWLLRHAAPDSRTSLHSPNRTPKWFMFFAAWISSIMTLIADTKVFSDILDYLSVTIDNCRSVNNPYVWVPLLFPSEPAASLSDIPQFHSSFSFYVDSLIHTVNSDIETLMQDSTLGLKASVASFDYFCSVIGTGCEAQQSPAYPNTWPYATECVMTQADLALFGGSAHRGFRNIIYIIISVRLCIELARMSLVLISVFSRRIVARHWSIDFVGSTAFAPLLYFPVGGSPYLFFDEVVNHNPTHVELAWRVVHQSLLSALPLLCANLYHLFFVSQSGIQFWGMFSLLGGLIIVILHITRFVLAWRFSDVSYSNAELQETLSVGMTEQELEALSVADMS